MLRKFRINMNGKEYMVEMEEIGAPVISAPIATQPVAAQSAPVAQPEPIAAPVAAQPVIEGEGKTIDSPMPGNILKVLVAVGDKVEVDQCLVILEAMKMENEIVAPKAGTVSAIHVTAGTSIDVGKPIITIV